MIKPFFEIIVGTKESCTYNNHLGADYRNNVKLEYHSGFDVLL